MRRTWLKFFFGTAEDLTEKINKWLNDHGNDIKFFEHDSIMLTYAGGAYNLAMVMVKYEAVQPVDEQYPQLAKKEFPEIRIQQGE